MGKEAMLIASVRLSRAGYRVHVVDAPLWALVIEDIAHTICCDRTGHPVCRGVGPFAWGLGSRLMGAAARRERPRWSAPLTVEDVLAHFPESLIDLGDQ
jgi:hypothetical protein